LTSSTSKDSYKIKKFLIYFTAFNEYMIVAAKSVLPKLFIPIDPGINYFPSTLY